jgi:hypothetical protein
MSMKFCALLVAVACLACTPSAFSQGKGKPQKNNTPKNQKPAKTQPQPQGKKFKNPAHHEAQKKSNAQLVQAYQALQGARVALARANHDYGGHRATALTAVGNAQNSLSVALSKYNVNVKSLPQPTVKGGNEKQSVSNAQINRAVKVVSQTIVHLENANHDYYGFRYKAVVDLRQAFQQLQLAAAAGATKK